MRRKDREICEFSKIKEVISRCDCIHISMCLENVPYVCTMNFGVSYEEEVYFYVHCANEGKKIDILRQHPLISFVMNCDHRFIDNVVAQKATMEYASVAGMASVEFVEDLAEKEKALNCIMNQYSKNQGNYDEKTLNHVMILKCQVSEISGKQHKIGVK